MLEITNNRNKRPRVVNSYAISLYVHRHARLDTSGSPCRSQSMIPMTIGGVKNPRWATEENRWARAGSSLITSMNRRNTPHVARVSFCSKFFYQSVIKVADFLSNIDTFGEFKKKLTLNFIHDCIVFNVKYFGECRIKIPLKETKSIRRNKIRNKTLLSTRVSTKTLYTHVILVSVVQRK